MKYAWPIVGSILSMYVTREMEYLGTKLLITIYGFYIPGDMEDLSYLLWILISLWWALFERWRKK